MPPKDDDLLTFIVTKRTDGKVYTLTVKSDSSITDEEFANCLTCYANEIVDGKITFDEFDGAIETDLQ